MTGGSGREFDGRSSDAMPTCGRVLNKRQPLQLLLFVHLRNASSAQLATACALLECLPRRRSLHGSS